MSARYGEPPDDLVAQVRAVAAGLPEAIEQKAWVGTRWQVRGKTFAHVLAVVDRGQTVMTFRAEGLELLALQQLGHPYLTLGWGRDAMGLVLTADTAWDEVAELVTDSWCVLAPRRLVASLEPSAPDGRRR